MTLFFIVRKLYKNTHHTHTPAHIQHIIFFHFVSSSFSTISGTLDALFAIQHLQLFHWCAMTIPEKPYENWKLDMITLHLSCIESLKLKRKRNSIEFASVVPHYYFSCWFFLNFLIGFVIIGFCRAREESKPKLRNTKDDEKFAKYFALSIPNSYNFKRKINTYHFECVDYCLQLNFTMWILIVRSSCEAHSIPYYYLESFITYRASGEY